MTENRHYKCDKCDGRTETGKEAELPQCCGQSMTPTPEPMDQCTNTSTAEHSRLDDTGEPCKDGRAG